MPMHDYKKCIDQLCYFHSHAWAFYAYLDEKEGIRWIYGKQGKDIIERLDIVLESLEKLIEPDIISYSTVGGFRMCEYGVKNEYDGYFGKDGWDISDPHVKIKNAHANTKRLLIESMRIRYVPTIFTKIAIILILNSIFAHSKAPYCTIRYYIRLY
jgi:hypothetical protein